MVQDGRHLMEQPDGRAAPHRPDDPSADRWLRWWLSHTPAQRREIRQRADERKRSWMTARSKVLFGLLEITMAKNKARLPPRVRKDLKALYAVANDTWALVHTDYEWSNTCRDLERLLWDLHVRYGFPVTLTIANRVERRKGEHNGTG